MLHISHASRSSFLIDPYVELMGLQILPNNLITLPETNIAHENPHLSWQIPSHGFSMAMLVSRSVNGWFECNPRIPSKDVWSTCKNCNSCSIAYNLASRKKCLPTKFDSEACGWKCPLHFGLTTWKPYFHDLSTNEPLTFSELLNGCSVCENVAKTWSCWRNETSLQPTRVYW